MTSGAMIPPLLGSNRTIVGLKRLTTLFKQATYRAQQSHHCGIETALVLTVFYLCQTQQSHHCGIETLSVGDLVGRLNLQQSHHCGIETEVRPPVEG